MRRVSQQGMTLSAAQRRQLDLQARMRAVGGSPLREQVEETLRAVEDLREQGAKPVVLNKVIERKKGTPSIAEWMGF
jgi:hypothetical protein